MLKDYSILIDAMEEIHHSTHDEYGLKARGILAALEKFEVLWVEVGSSSLLKRFLSVCKQKILHF